MEKTIYTTNTNKGASQVPDLRWVDKITKVMDSKFRIPGTHFRFGLDPILGLLPGLGDATSLAVSSVLIYYMYRYGASRKLVIMMAGNVVLDAVIGSIPILGTIFDFAYKANERNMRLLKRHYQEGKYRGGGTGILVAIVLIAITVIGLFLYGAWLLINYLIQLGS